MSEASDKLDRIARGQLAPAADKALPKRVRRIHARTLARVEFVQDPQKGSIGKLWKRGDRPYRDLWGADAFRDMARRDEWEVDRATFWDQVSAHVEKETQKGLAQALIRDTALLQEGFDALSEYFLPVRGEDGEIKRHDEFITVGDTMEPNPFAGLPVMPLEMRSFDQFIPAYMKVMDKLQANRATIDGSMTPQGIGGEETGIEEARMLPKPSQGVIDEMARQLVLAGQQSMDDFDGTDLPGMDSAGDHEVDDGFDTGDL